MRRYINIRDGVNLKSLRIYIKYKKIKKVFKTKKKKPILSSKNLHTRHVV